MKRHSATGWTPHTAGLRAFQHTRTPNTHMLCCADVFNAFFFRFVFSRVCVSSTPHNRLTRRSGASRAHARTRYASACADNVTARVRPTVWMMVMMMTHITNGGIVVRVRACEYICRLPSRSLGRCDRVFEYYRCCFVLSRVYFLDLVVDMSSMILVSIFCDSTVLAPIFNVPIRQLHSGFLFCPSVFTVPIYIHSAHSTCTHTHAHSQTTTSAHCWRCEPPQSKPPRVRSPFFVYVDVARRPPTPKAQTQKPKQHPPFPPFPSLSTLSTRNQRRATHNTPAHACPARRLVHA